MRRTLPPLNALRAFDAAGRLLSFSKAARELRVTQGAVSRHIQVLEQRLGVRLFHRLTRRIELTEAGKSYLQEIQLALDQIERATRNAHPRRKHSILTISVLPSIASAWLMPRLGAFTMAHPSIETRILTSIEPVDLQGGEADIAIRVGPLPGKHYEKWQPRIDLEMVANWKGVSADYLFPDVLTPVCSANMLGMQAKLERPEDLLSYPLIHTASRSKAWVDWFAAQGIQFLATNPSIGYGHFFMSVQAAREGLGAAIAPSILFSDQNSKDLYFPFDVSIPSAGEYYLLTLKTRRDEPEIVLFCSWLKAHASHLANAHRMDKSHA